MKGYIVKCVLLLFAGVVLMAGPGITGSALGQKPSDEYALGRQIYSNQCQFCHGMRGDGKGPAGYSMNPRPADFTDPRFWQGNDDKKMTAAIVNGRGMMPAFDMKPNEIKAVMDYISHAFKKTQ